LDHRQDALVGLAIPHQDALERAATDWPGAQEQSETPRPVLPAAHSAFRNQDQRAEKPGSEAKLRAAKRSEAKSHRYPEANRDRADREDVVIRYQDALEMEVTLDRAGRERQAILGQDDRQMAASLDRDDQVQRHRVHRCNTKFLHELMPYFLFPIFQVVSLFCFHS
jgi:hypothetical protein